MLAMYDMRKEPLKPPFPYFGSKLKIAGAVWQRFGRVRNYVEPFAGSLAVFLAAPYPLQYSTVNDIDGFVVNFWRAVKYNPDAVADFADWPKTELDLVARHAWLVAQSDTLVKRLREDPHFYDAKVAGWWVWWHSASIALKFGFARNMQQQLPDGTTCGVHRTLPQSYKESYDSICDAKSAWLRDYMQALADRLRFTNITCGDYSRTLSYTYLHKHGLTAVFLDPPYGAERKRLYRCDSFDILRDVREWCRENGGNPLLRIALCGYEGEHNELEEYGWRKVEWNSGSTRHNRNRVCKERIWYSPHCVPIGE